MKRTLIVLTAFAAVAALGGCAVVPYGAGYPVAQYDSMYSTQAYPPAYVSPPAYVAPPVYFGFGLNYRGGGYRNHYYRGYGHRGYGPRGYWH